MANLVPGSERVDGLRVAYTAADYQTMMCAWLAMLALGAA